MTDATAAGLGWISEFDTPTTPDQTWTAANYQEILPGIATPLTIGLLREISDRQGTRFMYDLGFLDTLDYVFTGFFYNRAYLCVSAFRAMAEQVPLSSPEAVDEQYLGKTRDPNAPRRRIPPRALPRTGKLVARVLRRMGQLPKELRQETERLDAWLAAERARPPAALTPAQLAARGQLGERFYARQAYLSAGAIAFSSASFDTLGSFLTRWLGEAELRATLCTGLDTIESARPALGLWQLAQQVRASEELSLLFAESPPAAVLAQIEASRAGSPHARRFGQSLDVFLQQFGHRALSEIELAHPAWADEPDVVIALIRGLLAGEAPDPFLTAERQRARRLEATRRVERRLGLPRRLIFRRLLGNAQTYLWAREQAKTNWTKCMHRLRQDFRELGRRLAAAGVLATPEDVFFLVAAEIYALADPPTRAESPAAREARATVARRRAEYERNRAVTLPETFTGRPLPLAVSTHEPSPAETTAVEPEPLVLRGMACSPGRVTGPARVIHSPETGERVLPGEVLVAPVTDAAWTPLFLSAAAVVVDIGGLLSHGSTVAREYGLPAVINVKTGTTRIPTGRLVTVDGDRGEVIVHGKNS